MTPAESRRLDGWKEIARHLGKGVRTTQRWEKQYGLPVRRLGPEAGDAVFAYAGELDAWMRDSSARGRVEDAPSAPPRRDEALPGKAAARRWRTAALLALAAAAVTAPWLALRPHAVPVRRAALPGPPESWQVSAETLTVRDAVGRLVFEHRFAFELSSLRSDDFPSGAAFPVRFADVDDDGRVEVLVAAPTISRENRRFYCFESDGRVRFTWRPVGGVRFGSVLYAAPWMAHGVWTTRSPGRAPALWVSFIHAFLFPTRLHRLGPRGDVQGEYWSDGYVLSVGEARWRGRDVVVVGAVSNEVRGGSLAVFDADAFGGSAPAVDPAYVCHSGSSGGPREFVVFPSSCLLQRIGGMSGVRAVSVEPDGRFVVQVMAGYGRPNDPEGREPVYLRYTLGRDLETVQLETSPEFKGVHDALAARGLLDHTFGRRDEEALLAVRRFAGSRYVSLPGPAAPR